MQLIVCNANIVHVKKTLKNINKNTFTPEFIQETNICNAVHITETNLKKNTEKVCNSPFY